MKKKGILLVVLLLAVGFAAVTTTLFINGTTNIGTNKSDFDVYYSKAKVNGVEDNSVITDDTHIVFTKEMKKVGETYVLDYDVTNGSRNYDASLTMTCTESNEYLTVTNVFDTSTNVLATETRSGVLTIELKKGYAGEETKEVTIECTINANAVERDSLASGIPTDKVEPSKYALSGTLVDENNNVLSGGAAALFSEPMYIDVGEDGIIDFGEIPAGEHHLCYVAGKKAADLKNMTQQQVMDIAKFCLKFTTQSLTITSPGLGGVTNIELGDTVDVALNANGGEVSKESIKVSTASTYRELPIPTRKGYQFLGWYSGDNEVTSATKYSDVKAKVLTAKWLKNKYNITVDGEKVTLNTTNVEIEYEGNGKVTATPLEGYYLTEFNCTNGYTTTANTGTSYTEAQEVTILNNGNDSISKCTAKAKAFEYDVTITTENATASSSTVKVAYGSSGTVTITPSSGYYLSSATCTNGYTTNAVVGKSSKSAQEITISNNNKTLASTCTFNSDALITITHSWTGNTASVGDVVTIGTEGFHVIKDNGDTVTLFADYSLGTDYRQTTSTTASKYTVKFSDSGGWPTTPAPKEIDIQEWSTNPKTYVNNYVDYLKTETGATSSDTLTGNLITLTELGKIGCTVPTNYTYKSDTSTRTCKYSAKKSWIVNKQWYWTRSVSENGSNGVWYVDSSGQLNFDVYNYAFGVRPVITISKSLI